MNAEIEAALKRVSNGSATDTDAQLLRAKLDRTTDALKLFTIAFKSRPTKIGSKWSFGYWDGYDAGLVLANGGKAEHLKDTDFHAVIQYSPGDIKEAMEAADE